MEMRKNYAKALIKYLLKMFIVAAIALLISFIISLKVEMSLKNITGYMALGLISIGGLAALGSNSVSRDTLYRQGGISNEWEYNNHKMAIESVADSYRFIIFMLGAGGIVALVSWIL